jgi:adenosine deaminase
VISDLDLKFEFEKAAPAAGLSEDDIAKAQANALEIAFLTPAERAALLAKKA